MYCVPCFASYQEEKGLHLRWDISASSFGPKEVPHSKFGTNLILGGSAGRRRGRFLYKPRIRSVIFGKTTTLPAIFPGPSPILELDSRFDGSSECLTGSTYRQFCKLLNFEERCNGAGAGREQTWEDACSRAWPWLNIEQPRLTEIECAKEGRRGKDSGIYIANLKAEASRLVDTCASGAALPSGLKEVFSMVHKSWAMSSSATYSAGVIEELWAILLEVVSICAGTRPLELLFELEMLASYGTLLEKMRPLASGTFSSCWLDVGTMSPSRIRGTERCEPARLLDEVRSLAYGKLAPLLINEYGCVADGNHRLAAAWIWNILHACRHLNWSLSDDSFQQAVADFVAQSLTPTSMVSLHEALKCLGVFLSNEYSSWVLCKDLRPYIYRVSYDELPVIPLLEYCALAVVGSDYAAKRYKRFEPEVYGKLLQTTGGILPARACYHFADIVPLPWFSLNARGTVNPGVDDRKTDVQLRSIIS